MNIITIQVRNPKVLKLLQYLEELQLIKVVSEESKASDSLSKKYAGSLSTEIGEELQRYIKQSRDEWERNI